MQAAGAPLTAEAKSAHWSKAAKVTAGISAARALQSSIMPAFTPTTVLLRRVQTKLAPLPVNAAVERLAQAWTPRVRKQRATAVDAAALVEDLISEVELLGSHLHPQEKGDIVESLLVQVIWKATGGDGAKGRFNVQQQVLLDRAKAAHSSIAAASSNVGQHNQQL